MLVEWSTLEGIDEGNRIALMCNFSIISYVDSITFVGWSKNTPCNNFSLDHCLLPWKEIAPALFWHWLSINFWAFFFNTYELEATHFSVLISYFNWCHLIKNKVIVLTNKPQVIISHCCIIIVVIYWALTMHQALFEAHRRC